MSMTRKEELKKQAYAKFKKVIDQALDEYVEVGNQAYDKYLKDIEEIDNNYDS